MGAKIKLIWSPLSPGNARYDPTADTDAAPDPDHAARRRCHRGRDRPDLRHALRGAVARRQAAGLPYLPLFMAYAAIVYFAFGLHRNKWRFTSLPDLFNIFRVSTVLAASLLAVDYVLVAPNVYGHFFFGKITILLYWFLQIFFLGGFPGRLPLFPLFARPPARARPRRHPDPGARHRRRRRGPAARSRKRRGQEHLDGRRAVAVARRPRPVNPRRAGARRRRRPGNRGRRPCRPRHAGRPPDPRALGAVTGSAPGVDPGARPQARA